jgi:hypothetical protein
MRELEYIDDVPISAAVLADSGLYFVGDNSQLQRGEMLPGPFANLRDDVTHWQDINVWISQQGVWNDTEDVPILILRPQRLQPAWLWSRVAWGSTALLSAIAARDVRCDYGLAVYIRGKDLPQALPADSLVLHIRGRYER